MESTSTSSSIGSPYLFAGLVVIGFASVWAGLFSATCSGDGCIGVVYLAGGGVLALLVQLLVLLPIFCYRNRRTDAPMSHVVALWVILSLGAFLAPLILGMLLI